MFSLLYGLWQYMFQKDVYCVLIIGLDNSGKTTFLEQAKIHFNRGYRGMRLDRITTTVGLNVGTIDMGGSRVIFWDLGGQSELRSLWDKYFSECHGVIYLIDAADPERVKESKDTFDRVMRSELLQGVPVLLVANKQDKEGALSLSQIREIFDLNSQMVGVRDHNVVQASALTGTGISDSISWLVNCIQQNSTSRPPLSAPD